MSESGAPGEEADITIRGLSTLSDAGVRPLYIVDGVPLKSINNINPKDIQSMEILKDAASAAIYRFPFRQWCYYHHYEAWRRRKTPDQPGLFKEL